MSNELFAAFIEWLSKLDRIYVPVIEKDIRAALNDQDTIEQQALNYFIDQYDSITQS